MNFKHDAIFYSGDKDFVDLIGSFMAGGIAAGEPVMAMLAPRKIRVLRGTLGSRSERAQFVDMTTIGRNPARIIPVWRSFVSRAANGCSVRGISEPVWAGRSEQEVIEAQRHEELINLALGDGPCWLICPYDRTNLDPSALDHAAQSHPTLFDGQARRPSARYRGLDEITQPIDRPLPDPSPPVLELSFTPGPLVHLRSFVAHAASRLGLDEQKGENLIMAAGEAAGNTLRHGGGSGTVRVWRDGGAVVCEVRDAGRIDNPLAGRIQPDPANEGGYGLWLANQLCDLVQIRSNDLGTVVRMQMQVSD